MSRQSKAWQVVAMLFIVAVLNYFDRQSLSVVAPKMQAEMHLSDAGYAHIVSLFLLASAFAYGLSGFVCDRVGVQGAMAIFVGVWSLAELSTSFAGTPLALAASRFCLGLGEPGLWVAAPKAVGEIVAPARRGLAVGIYTAGATVGAVIAIPVILAVTSHLPWRSIFWIDGVLGLLWVPIWWFIYRRPPASGQAGYQASPLSSILRKRETWQLLLVRGLTDPVWYFFLFWFPKFLLSDRHLTTLQLSRYGWIVYLAGGIGTVAAGIFTARQIKLGKRPAMAYRLTMTLSAVAVLGCPLTYLLGNTGLSLLCASIVALAHMAWLTSLTAMLLEIFPADPLGRAAGLIAAGSAFGGIISSELLAVCLVHGGYRPVFYAMGFLHILALTILWPAFYTKRPSLIKLAS